MINNKPLFIFELANNHNGNEEFGVKIINEISKVAEPYKNIFDFAFKFQYRNLETFIHPDFKNRVDMKYIKRFLDTELKESNFLNLKSAVEKNGLKTICTPFDEISVDKIISQNYDIIKIASCSFTDWPLLEKIATAGKSVIASTAGSSLEEIDNVVTFFTNRKVDLTLMHCVGEYPTIRENLQLNQIDLLKNRYKDLKIGFSTHEEPSNMDSIRIAISKGASVFERHVALNSPEYLINGYSSTPEQVAMWLETAKDTLIMCGVFNERKPMTDKELNDLRGLKRGVFSSIDIKAGELIDLSKVMFAIPCGEEQLLANDMSKYNEYVASVDIKKFEAIDYNKIQVRNMRLRIAEIIEQVRKVILDSKIALPSHFEMEISHHYGVENFEENGAVILSIVNREYCKKLIVLLPNQKHPVHYHVKKEETFNVLYGELQVELNGEDVCLKEGSLLTVERGDKHSFYTKSGCIFEEISTTHYKDDSYYDDEKIANSKKRKTIVPITLDYLLEGR